MVEYAFKDIQKTIGGLHLLVHPGVADTIREELPTVEDLQEVISKLRAEIEALKPENPDER